MMRFVKEDILKMFWIQKSKFSNLNYSPSLIIKKLRYYARFIVVCLLLDRIAIVKKLMEELTTLVGEYTETFKPTDSAEWNVVLSEISTFLEVKPIIVIF